MSVSASVGSSRRSSDLGIDVQLEHLCRRIEALEKRLAACAVPGDDLEWQAEWMPRVLEVLERTGNASEAIRAVTGKANRGTVYKYKRRCPRFRARWAAAVKAHRTTQS